MYSKWKCIKICLFETIRYRPEVKIFLSCNSQIFDINDTGESFISEFLTSNINRFLIVSNKEIIKFSSFDPVVSDLRLKPS